MTDTPRVTRTLATAAKTEANAAPTWEVGGIFWWPDLNPWGNEPAFLPLPNRHPDYEKNFQIDYADITTAFLTKYGTTSERVDGEVTLFHSHPFGTGQPSRMDQQAIEDFAKEMDGHPMLRPTFRHLIFSLWDQSWWWFDLESFGKIGWEWPE